jgi:signal transduction histidine kinase
LPLAVASGAYGRFRTRSTPIGGWCPHRTFGYGSIVTQSGAAQVAIELARPGRRPAVLRSPAVAIVAISAAVALPLVVLSILDTAGLRPLWDNLQWTVSAIGAALATAVGIRGSIGRARTIRIAMAIAFGLGLIANLSFAYLNLVGRATIPSVAELFIFATLAPWLFTIPASIRGRVPWADAAAVYLDSALIVCLIGTILFIVHGPVALALPFGAGVIALAFPTAFIGLGGAGLVAILSASYPLAPRGASAVSAGLAIVGLAYLGWIAPTVDGVAAGELPSLLFTVGTLVTAFGAATWQDERNDKPSYVKSTRYLSRAIGPTAAGLVFLTLLLPFDPNLHMIDDAAVFVAGGLFLTRQALLLRERTTMLDEVTRLKLDNDRLVGELRTELEQHAFDQRRLIQASRAAAVGELAAGVAHEVNNPLAAVLGFAELLYDDLDPDDPRRADVETIRAQALRARSIVRALGDFAQSGVPSLAPTELGDLVRRTVDLVRFQVERRGVTIEERYAVLPEVLVDPHAIQQAVINVLTNATQAVADGGVIEISVEAADAFATIVVSDDGVGMTDTTAHRAFEPFFTGRDADLDGGLATGLGLAVSRGLIEAQSGTISLTSRPGLGTRVELRLPLYQPTAADDGSALGGEVE